MGLIPTSVDIELGMDSLMIVCFKAKCSIYIRFMITFIKVSYLLNVCLYLLFVCDKLFLGRELACKRFCCCRFLGGRGREFLCTEIALGADMKLDIFLGLRPYV